MQRSSMLRVWGGPRVWGVVAAVAVCACYASKPEDAVLCGDDAAGCGEPAGDDEGTPTGGRDAPRDRFTTEPDPEPGRGGAGADPASAGATPKAQPSYDPPPAVCGNGYIDPGEMCDGDTFARPESCEHLFGPQVTGRLACNADCTLDTSLCHYTMEPDAMPPPPDSDAFIDACIARIQSVSPDRGGAYALECQACLCEQCPPEGLTLCDDACWRLVECVYAYCGGASPVDITCVLNSCADAPAAANNATMLMGCVPSCEGPCLPDWLGRLGAE